MQEVWSLIQEDPTCLGATKLVHHNYWAFVPRACALQEKPPQWEAPQLDSKCCLPQRDKSLLSSAAAAAAEPLQLCLTLCDPIDGSPPGSPVPGILQARTLEWVAISFSAWKWKVKVKSLSRVRLLATPWTAAH